MDLFSTILRETNSALNTGPAWNTGEVGAPRWLEPTGRYAPQQENPAYERKPNSPKHYDGIEGVKILRGTYSQAFDDVPAWNAGAEKASIPQIRFNNSIKETNKSKLESTTKSTTKTSDSNTKSAVELKDAPAPEDIAHFAFPETCPSYLSRSWKKCLMFFSAQQKRRSWQMAMLSLHSMDPDYRLKFDMYPTAMFENGKLILWLFTSKKNGMVMRKSHNNMYMKTMAAAFLERPGLVTYYLDHGHIVYKHPSADQTSFFSSLALNNGTFPPGIMLVQTAAKPKSIAVTCYMAHHKSLRDDVHGVRLVCNSFKLLGNKRVVLQSSEMQKRLGELTKQIARTSEHGIQDQYVYLEAIWHIDEISTDVTFSHIGRTLTSKQLIFMASTYNIKLSDADKYLVGLPVGIASEQPRPQRRPQTSGSTWSPSASAQAAKDYYTRKQSPTPRVKPFQCPRPQSAQVLKNLTRKQTARPMSARRARRNGHTPLDFPTLSVMPVHTSIPEHDEDPEGGKSHTKASKESRTPSAKKVQRNSPPHAHGSQRRGSEDKIRDAKQNSFAIRRSGWARTEDTVQSDSDAVVVVYGIDCMLSHAHDRRVTRWDRFLERRQKPKIIRKKSSRRPRVQTEDQLTELITPSPIVSDGPHISKTRSRLRRMTSFRKAASPTEQVQRASLIYARGQRPDCQGRGLKMTSAKESREIVLQRKLRRLGVLVAANKTGAKVSRSSMQACMRGGHAREDWVYLSLGTDSGIGCWLV